jgi:hypothetical protein
MRLNFFTQIYSISKTARVKGHGRFHQIPIQGRKTFKTEPHYNDPAQNTEDKIGERKSRNVNIPSANLH